MKTKNKLKATSESTDNETATFDSKENDEMTKKVSFSNDTVDNSNDEPPRKKNKKRNDDVTIKPREPTEEELIECQKPENVKAVVSKRKEKKKKYDELVAQQKLESELVARQKNLNYLSLWKHNRSEWKFAKVKQSWLQKHMLDSDMVPKEHWKTLIDYFSGSKGQVRQTIIKECMDVIEKSDTAEEEEEAEMDKTKYERARDMVQCLEE